MFHRLHLARFVYILTEFVTGRSSLPECLAHSDAACHGSLYICLFVVNVDEDSRGPYGPRIGKIMSSCDAKHVQEGSSSMPFDLWAY